MAIIDQITSIANIILYILLAVCVVGTCVFIYMRKFRKKSAAKEDSIDYSQFDRRDSMDYIRLEDIRDDMVITENGTRFVGMIKCSGFDFYSAHASEQLATETAYRSVIGMIDRPVTYRQSCRKVDMEDNEERYYQAGQNLKEKLENCRYLHSELVLQYESLVSEKNPEALEAAGKLSAQIEETERQMEAYSWRLNHIAAQMDWMAGMGSSDSILEKDECYIFDWKYNPLDYPMELTDEEIHDKARKELAKTEHSFVHALSNCRVRARRMHTGECIDLYRRHFKPYSAEIFRQSDLDRSAYYDDIVSVPKQSELYDRAVNEVMTDISYKVLEKDNVLENMSQEEISALKEEAGLNGGEEPGNGEITGREEIEIEFDGEDDEHND